MLQYLVKFYFHLNFGKAYKLVLHRQDTCKNLKLVTCRLLVVMINGACKAWICTNKFEVSQELHYTSGLRTVLTAQFDCIDWLVLWCLHLMSQSQTWLLTICWIKIKIQSSTSYEVRPLLDSLFQASSLLVISLLFSCHLLLIFSSPGQHDSIVTSLMENL